MTDYVQLNGLWAGLAAPANDPELATAGLPDSQAGREIFLARDARGRVHLLVHAGGEGQIKTDRTSGGVLLVGQLLEIEGESQLFADLVCVDRDLQPVFEQLAADVCTRILASEDSPLSALRTALGEWRDLLRSRRTGPGLAEIIGLRGELEVVRQMALVAPSDAIAAWTGPSRGMHDFQRGSLLLEIKTTTAQSGSVIHVNGLRQLDPPPDQDLYVLLFRLLPDDTAESVSDLVSDLLDIGVPRDQLMESVEKLGYWHDDPSGWEGSFRVASSAAWRIDDDFPGLRESRMTPAHIAGIGDITYEIDLEAGGAPMKPEDAQLLLSRFVKDPR